MSINIMLIFWLIVTIIRRFILNKEHKIRWKERLAITNIKKETNLETIWIHCVSIGEFKSMIKIIKQITESNKYFVILTTTTLTSAKCVENYNFKNLIHQFNPVDSFIVIRKFLNYWNPKEIIFCESEIWPITIFLSSFYGKVYLVNGNLSDKSFKIWKFFGIFFKSIISKFHKIYPNDLNSYKKFKEFNLPNLSKKYGSTKFDNIEEILKIKEKNKNLINNFKKNNKEIIITFGSVHFDDISNIAIQISEILKIENSKIILYPRYIDSKNILKIENKLLKIIDNLEIIKPKDLEYILNDIHSSSRKVIIIQSLDITIPIYEISNIVCIGGSFSYKTKGCHNALESIFLKKPTIIGRNYKNIISTIETLQENEVIYISENEKLSFLIKDIINNNNILLNNIKIEQFIKKINKDSITDFILKDIFN